MLRKINSKIILKISIFIFIEIILIIGSFGILAYFQIATLAAIAVSELPKPGSPPQPWTTY